MVRVLYVLGALATLTACGILEFCLQWRLNGKQLRVPSWDVPGAVQRFRESHEGLKHNEKRAPPLVKQAEAFAAYLTSAQPAKKAETPVVRQETAAPVPAIIRPVAASVQFKLVATSYYPDQPKRSMALISEPDSGGGSERWVKEGAQVEHFVIHEIRHGLIVYRDGDNLREMAVEGGMGAPSLVQDAHLGVRRISAAVDGTGTPAPVAEGPNSIEIAGGN